MQKPKFLIARHFVNNDATLSNLHEGITNLKTAESFLKKEDPTYTIGLKLTVNNLDTKLREEVKEELRRLPLSMWFMFDPIDRGPGISTLQVQLNPTFNKGIVINVDLDQYEIETKQGLKSIADLVKDVEEKNHLYAVGSRNVPVVLGKHSANSRLREIHELFHSCTIPDLTMKNHPEGVSSAYAIIGESTSGFTIINHTHYNYPSLVSRVTKASQKASFRGFTAEYYISIASSELGTRGKGYVQTKINPFPNEIEEERERLSFVKFIEHESKELGKTDIKDKILSTIKREENTKRILDFYSEKEVSLVRDLMKKGIEGR